MPVGNHGSGGVTALPLQTRRGVSILIHKTVHFKLVEEIVATPGRYVILQCTIMYKPLIVIAVYVPPPANLPILKEVLSYCTSFPGTAIVLLGDFPMV